MKLLASKFSGTKKTWTSNLSARDQKPISSRCRRLCHQLPVLAEELPNRRSTSYLPGRDAGSPAVQSWKTPHRHCHHDRHCRHHKCYFNILGFTGFAIYIYTYMCWIVLAYTGILIHTLEMSAGFFTSKMKNTQPQHFPKPIVCIDGPTATRVSLAILGN